MWEHFPELTNYMFFSERCLQECEMWPRKLCCHIFCTVLRVQMQASIQTTQLQKRSVLIMELCHETHKVLVYLHFNPQTFYCIRHLSSWPLLTASPCRPNPCQNGGSCTKGPKRSSYFQCSCPTGYSGKFCEVSKYDHLSQIEIHTFSSL